MPPESTAPPRGNRRPASKQQPATTQAETADADSAYSHRPLARELIERAIAKYHEALENRDTAYRRYNAVDRESVSFHEGRQWETWLDVATGELGDAERLLIQAILAMNGRGVDNPNLHGAAKHIHRPAAVIFGGKMYVATPDPEDTDEPDDKVDPGGCDMTHLLVVDASAITDLNVL